MAAIAVLILPLLDVLTYCFIAAFIWLERYRCASSAIHWAYSLSNFINCSIANVFKVYKCSDLFLYAPGIFFKKYKALMGPPSRMRAHGYTK